MVIGIVAAVAVVVAAVVLLGRRRSTEVHSVKGYRQTLSTLEHLQEHPRHERVPLSRGSDRLEGRSEGGSEARRDVVRVPPRPMGPPAGRRAQRSLSVMNHGPRRMGAPIAVLALLVVLVGALLYIGLRSHPRTPAGSHATSTTVAGHHRKTSAPTTTTTTLPAQYTAVTTTTNSATYAPATTTYTLVVGATSGSCWMSITNAQGTTVMAQALTAGSSQSFSLSGKASILIGAPTVAALKVDNVPVVLPSGAQAPFTVTLVPAGG